MVWPHHLRFYSKIHFLVLLGAWDFLNKCLPPPGPPSRSLNKWQWKMNMGVFECHGSFQGCNFLIKFCWHFHPTFTSQLDLVVAFRCSSRRGEKVFQALRLVDSCCDAEMVYAWYIHLNYIALIYVYIFDVWFLYDIYIYIYIQILYVLKYYPTLWFTFTGSEYSIKVPVTKIDFILPLFARSMHFVYVIISSFNANSFLTICGRNKHSKSHPNPSHSWFVRPFKKMSSSRSVSSPAVSMPDLRCLWNHLWRLWSVWRFWVVGVLGAAMCAGDKRLPRTTTTFKKKVVL